MLSQCFALDRRIYDMRRGRFAPTAAPNHWLVSSKSVFIGVANADTPHANWKSLFKFASKEIDRLVSFVRFTLCLARVAGLNSKTLSRHAPWRSTSSLTVVRSLASTEPG